MNYLGKECFMEFNQFDRGVFVVNVLGIIYDERNKKILIGRRENDPYIKELTWCFPGGRPGYDQDLEEYLKIEVRKKTTLDVEVEEIIFAKTYPEERKFLSIYYLCNATPGNEKAGDKFVELKWINPPEVADYFTTSLHPKLLEYLKSL
jgi:ADP-ribose pyrophosphatase YjhB (NUDIX family)